MRGKYTTPGGNQMQERKMPSSNSPAEEEIFTASPYPEAVDG